MNVSVCVCVRKKRESNDVFIIEKMFSNDEENNKSYCIIITRTRFRVFLNMFEWSFSYCTSTALMKWQRGLKIRKNCQLKSYHNSQLVPLLHAVVEVASENEKLTISYHDIQYYITVINAWSHRIAAMHFYYAIEYLQ